MRNLKRALSLGLTAAMISGLMVMGSSAASYADVTSEQNQEAIEVLQAVGIMVGDEKGNFNPDQNVTRNEMAVVMSNLMAYNVATYKNTSPFTDVPSWAEPYVAACWTNGITAGYDADTYGGNDTVTTAQAALMLMKALGYFQYESDFGNDWQLATVSQGNRIDLFEDVDSGVREAMTRNDLAQLVLNTLEAGTVEADSDITEITSGDVSVVTGKVDYTYITSGEKYAKAIDSELDAATDGTTSIGSIVQLGEKLYQGDLECDDTNDDFGRPATMWTYKSNEVGTFADEADSSWTGKVSEKDLYQAAGSAAYNNYTWYVYRNGEPVKDMDGVDGADLLSYGRTSNERWNNTGNGVLTEMYVDSRADNGNGEVVVTLIDTFVAEVTNVDDDGDGEYTINISYKSDRPSGAETEYVTDQAFEDDDIVLVTIGQKEIQSMAVAETVSGTVSGVKDNDYIRLDGTTYNYNRAYTVDSLYNKNAGLVNLDDGDKYINPDLDNEITLYLDAYGNAVAIEGAEDSIDDYLYVTGVDEAYGDYSIKAIFADGTEKTVDIDDVDGNPASKSNLKENTVYKWSESGSAYDLETASYGDFETVTWEKSGSYGNGVIERDKASIAGGSDTAIADNNTVYVHVDDEKVWTGYKNVPSMTGIYGEAVVDDGVVTVMFIGDSEGSTAEDDDFVYVSGKDAERVKIDGDTLYQYHDSYVNQDGELVEGEFIATSKLDAIKGDGLYQVKERDSDGYATKVESVVAIDSEDGFDFSDAYATRAEGGILNLSGNYDKAGSESDGTYQYDDDTFFLVVELKADNTDTDRVYKGDVNDIETDEEGLTSVYVLTVDDKSDETPLAEMVLVIVPDEDTNTPIEDDGDTITLGVGTKTGTGTAIVEINGEERTITETSSDTQIKFDKDETITVKVIATDNGDPAEAEVSMSADSKGRVMKTSDGYRVVNAADGDVLVITPKV